MIPLRDSAIVLSRARSGETSLDLVLLTRGHGWFRATARGALRKAGSPMAASLSLLRVPEVVLGLGRAAGGRAPRAWVREATPGRHFPGLASDLARLEAACYFAELGRLALPEAHPAPEVFDLVVRGLEYLNAKPASLEVVRRFERRLLLLLGLGPPPERGALRHFANVFGQNFGRLPACRAPLLARLSP